MHVCDPEAPKHQSMLNQKQLKPPRSRQQMEISILMCTCVHGKSLNFYAYPAHDRAGRDGGTMSHSGSLLENEGTKGILLMQDAWSLISSFITSWYHHSSHTIDREQKGWVPDRAQRMPAALSGSWEGGDSTVPGSWRQVLACPISHCSCTDWQGWLRILSNAGICSKIQNYVTGWQLASLKPLKSVMLFWQQYFKNILLTKVSR